MELIAILMLFSIAATLIATPIVTIIVLVKIISHITNPEKRIEIKQRIYKENLEAQERARQEYEKEHNK